MLVIATPIMPENIKLFLMCWS